MKVNKVKRKLNNGEQTLGIFLHFYAPSIVEMLGHAGFDFVVLDNEHGGFTDPEIEHLIRAAECADIVPIVRLSYDPSAIQKALDRGARGIQVPMVNTKEQAEIIVRKAKYPPYGERGTSYSIRPAKFGKLSGETYLDHENENTFIIVQIESSEAVHNFEEIIAVPGIDAAFIGPLDLSISMGYKKEGIKHPDVQKVIEQLYEIGRSKGMPMGTIAPTIHDLREVTDRGTQYILAVGTVLLSNAFSNYVDEFSNHQANPKV